MPHTAAAGPRYELARACSYSQPAHGRAHHRPVRSQQRGGTDLVITVFMVAILALAVAIGAAFMVYKAGKGGMAAALVLVGIVMAVAVVALIIALLPGGGQTPPP